ncbi:MAG: AEC family transporter, partial [Firmicutes bacterium]|nr:AEC family transporter [Bacillota bacterium]
MDTNLTMVAAIAIGKMLVMVIVGFAAAKIHILGETETNAVTKTVLNVTCPMLILASYMQAFDPTKALGLLIALGLGVLIHVAGIVLANLTIRKEGNPNWQVERMAIVYGNVGFMGIPLMSAMFGPDAVFYLSTICLVYNFMIWSHGLLLMTGKMDKASLKK